MQLTPRRTTLSALSALLVLSACAENYVEPTFSVQSDLDAISRGTENTAYAVAFLKDEIRKNPTAVSPLNDLGQVYLNIGSFGQAAAAYNEALLLSPKNASARLGVARAYNSLGRYDQAIKALDSNVAGFQSVPLKNSLAVAYAGKNRCSEALEIFESILAQKPRDLDVRTNIALCKARMGDPMAVSEMRNIAMAPDARQVHFNNLVLVGYLLKQNVQADNDAAAFGVDKATMRQIKDLAAATASTGRWAAGVAQTEGRV